MDCIFCKIINKEIPSKIVYEDERVLAILDISQATYGHTLVMPKTHAKNIYEIKEDDYLYLMKIVKMLAVKIKNNLNAKGINIINNNDIGAGQSVMHYHVHIVPRYDNDDFKIKGGTLWDNITYYELYEKAHTPWQWHEKLQQVAYENGLVFFSSPFDKTAVDYLEKLNVPAYKIASFEINDIPLIEYAASFGKPVILSTGAAYKEEIEDAVAACRKVGNNNIILLKCTSSYPAPIDEANLKMIKRMGSLSKILGFLPGLGKIKQAINQVDDKAFVYMEAIISSMTEKERRNPKLIEDSAKRRERIAKGSGRTIQEVNGLRNSLSQMRDAMKKFNNMSDADKKKMSSQVANGNMSSLANPSSKIKKGKGKNKGRFRY